jgi:hypothetical protein
MPIKVLKQRTAANTPREVKTFRAVTRWIGKGGLSYETHEKASASFREPDADIPSADVSSAKGKARKKLSGPARAEIEHDLLRVLRGLEAQANASTVTWASSSTVTLGFYDDIPYYQTSGGTDDAVRAQISRARYLADALVTGDRSTLKKIRNEIAENLIESARREVGEIINAASREAEDIRRAARVQLSRETAALEEDRKNFEQAVEDAVRARIDQIFGRAATLKRSRSLTQTTGKFKFVEDDTHGAPGCTQE